MRIEHANITTADMEKSKNFYMNIFEFEQRWEGMIQGDYGPLKACHMGNKDTFIALFEAEEEVSQEQNYRKPGLNHIAFEVENLEHYRERLNREGTAIHLEGDYEPGRRLYFFDPNGVEIELVEYS